LPHIARFVWEIWHAHRADRPVTLRAHRYQAALGAVIGSTLGSAMAEGRTVWGPVGVRSLDQAERLLRGDPIDFDLSPFAAVPAAVHLSAIGAGPPLLVDTDTTWLVNLVHSGLERLPAPTIPNGSVRRALDLSADLDFVAAVEASDGDAELAVLVGGLAGLRLGLGRIPAELATYVGDGQHRGRRYLVRLTERLLGLAPPPPRDPSRRLGPREVAPGLWVSNIHAVAEFAARHPEGAIISLCATEGRVDHHRVRREFYLADTPDRDENPDLPGLLTEILSEIETFRAEGRPVLVHCRYGASRTGLVLRAWLMETQGLDDEQALMEAQCRWPKTSSWNRRWNAELARRADLREAVDHSNPIS